MRKIDLAYLAGVMDSDGFFTIKRSSYKIRVTKDCKNPVFFERVGVKQVQPHAIKLIHKNFGGYFRLEKPTAKNGKPLFAVQLTNLKAQSFVKFIYPYLRIKKQQADILFKLRKSINQGKQFRHPVIQKSRWGKPMNSFGYSLSKKQINYRNFLFKKIKSLNDSRNDKSHQPLPF